jgi:nicotinate-nucleotide pyrophosphorylase (carboxylating)
VGHLIPETLDTSKYCELLRTFLAEDIGAGDITTNTLVPTTMRAQGELLPRVPLVLAGLDIFLEIFRLLDRTAEAEINRHDGEELAAGELPARLKASAHALLSGERVALNLLQRLSGIATLTRSFVCAVEGTGVRIMDTRKTTPGLRALEKYAVRVGGGHNHRSDLAEAVLIKENHIRLAGGVSVALRAAERARGRSSWIAIEVTRLDELRAVLSESPNVILLDNMNPAMVRQAVERVRSDDRANRIEIEASGGITLENVREFAEAGVDRVSIGRLTHSAPAVDLSFEIEPE